MSSARARCHAHALVRGFDDGRDGTVFPAPTAGSLLTRRPRWQRRGGSSLPTAAGPLCPGLAQSTETEADIATSGGVVTPPCGDSRGVPDENACPLRCVRRAETLRRRHVTRQEPLWTRRPSMTPRIVVAGSGSWQVRTCAVNPATPPASVMPPSPPRRSTCVARAPMWARRSASVAAAGLTDSV